MKNKILYLILTYKIDSKNIEQHLDFQKKIVNYFKEQLSDGKISEALIGYLIRLDATDDVSVKYIYEFIDNLVIQNNFSE